MEFSVPGFIKRFCTPNAVLTLAEYLMDYAQEDTKVKGWENIENELKGLEDGGYDTKDLRDRVERVKAGERDLYY
jgi:2-iminoacetate synthase